MIIVTGATGNIGRELVKLLVATKTAARALVRDPAKAKDLGLEAVKGDLSDPESLDRAFEGANHLFLLCANSLDQVKHERNAVQAAKRAGFHHIVKLSVYGVSPTSPIQLARWHAEIESEIKSSGLGWTFLQPHYFAQNLLGQAATIRSQGAMYGAVGDGKVPFVDVRDIATVAFATLTQPGYMGRSFVLTGGHAYTHAEAADLIGKALGKEVRYVDVAPEALLNNLLGVGMPEWLAKDVLGLQTFFRTGAAAEVTPTIQEITRKPARTLADFVQDYTAAFRG